MRVIIQIEDDEIKHVIADTNVEVCVQNGAEAWSLDGNFDFPVQIYTPLKELQNVNQTA